MTAPNSHDVSTRAVYDHSAKVYADLVGTRLSPNSESAADIALLDAFGASLMDGSVLDVGCGPGRVAAHLTDLLADRKIEIAGVDLSSGMIEQARAAHPNIPFTVAPLTELPVTDRALAGAVLWYSIIHTPLDALGVAFTEVERVLRPEGRVLVAFQSGANDVVERVDAHGSSTTLINYRHDVDGVIESMRSAGFTIETTTTRDAEFHHESSPQTFLVASLTS